MVTTCLTTSTVCISCSGPGLLCLMSKSHRYWSETLRPVHTVQISSNVNILFSIQRKLLGVPLAFYQNRPIIIIIWLLSQGLFVVVCFISHYEKKCLSGGPVCLLFSSTVHTVLTLSQSANNSYNIRTIISIFQCLTNFVNLCCECGIPHVFCFSAGPFSPVVHPTMTDAWWCTSRQYPCSCIRKGYIKGILLGM